MSRASFIRRLMAIFASLALITGLSIASTSPAQAISIPGLDIDGCGAHADGIDIGYGTVTGTGNVACSFRTTISIKVCVQRYAGYWYDLNCTPEGPHTWWPAIVGTRATATINASGWVTYRIKVYGQFYADGRWRNVTSRGNARSFNAADYRFA